MHADSGAPIASGGIRLALDASQFLRLASEAGRHAPRYSVMGLGRPSQTTSDSFLARPLDRKSTRGKIKNESGKSSPARF